MYQDLKTNPNIFEEKEVNQAIPVSPLVGNLGLTKELKANYGQPDITFDTIKKNKCKHYYYRISPTEFGCKECGVGWLDNGQFQFKDGAYNDFTSR